MRASFAPARSANFLEGGTPFVRLAGEYKRHGTTTFSAALDVATGQVIGQRIMRHRHQDGCVSCG
jgi:hypothetical protein